MVLFCNMFVVLYTAKFVYICVIVTCSKSTVLGTQLWIHTMYACMYVCIYVSMYVCLYVCICVCMYYLCIYVRMYEGYSESRYRFAVKNRVSFRIKFYCYQILHSSNDFPTYSPPLLRHLSQRGTSFCIPSS